MATLVEEARHKLQSTVKERTEFAASFTEFAKTRSDVQGLAPEMMRVAQENDALINGILTDPNVRNPHDQVFRFLYNEARDRAGDTLATAANRAAAEQQEADRQAKTTAHVGSNATTSQTKPKTGVDAFKAAFREVLFDDPTSIRSGLTTE